MRPYPRSAEQHLAALEKILADWRDRPYRTDIYRQIAISEIKALGFTEGDAERWLRSVERLPPRIAS